MIFKTEQDIQNKTSYLKQSKLFNKSKLIETKQDIQNRASYLKTSKLFETEKVI